MRVARLGTSWTAFNMAIQVRDETGAFRVIYLANRQAAVYVLHAFRKTTQKTAARDLALAALRLRQLVR